MTNSEQNTQIAAARLPEIEAELLDILQTAHNAAKDALEAGSRAGSLLHEAQALCERSQTSFRDWLQNRIKMNRDRARTLINLHIDWPRVKERMDNQLMFDYGGAKRMIDSADTRKHSVSGAVFDETVSIGSEAYEIPNTLTVDFQYPDEDEDEPVSASTRSTDTTIAAVESIYRYVIPRKLETREDWRTCLVRFIGTAFLLGVMPDNLSMRDACAALGVSHATVSKYVRQLADATGIRSPIQKRESARKVYSDVQKADHWRRRGEG